MFGGIFRIVVALSVRFHNWGWLLLHGVIILLLGISIWRQWPLSGAWALGLLVGIRILLSGWSMIALGMAAETTPPRAPNCRSCAKPAAFFIKAM